MSENGKIDYPDGNDDREDIQRFENYNKCSNTKHLETLKNEDILNYIKDFEQNCRLEASSNDEDSAGVKKSSNRSARCSGTRFKSFKKPLSLKATSRKNKNIALERKTKLSSDHNATKACDDCCSARKYHFRGNPDLTGRKNSRKDLNTSPKFSHQRPYLSRDSYKYRASSPTFYGWYSRKDHKTRPTVTEMASLEAIKDRSQNAICDFRNNKSKISSGNSAKVCTSKSLRRRKFSDSTYTKIHSITAPNEKTTERDPRYRVRKQREETWMRKLNEESDVSEHFVDQQPLNKIYADQDIAFSYQSPLQNGGYKEYYTKEHPVQRYRQPTSWGLRSRSNRLTASARLPETSSLSRGRTSQWENEIRPPLKASTSIMEASIDKNYRRETKRKNNTDQRRRKPDVLGERESSCYCRPGLLRESGKLCKVVRTEDKQQLGYCREDAERDETLDCSRYCRCSENLNDFTRPQFKSTRLPIARSKLRANYTATLRRVSPESVRSRDNDEGESEINLSMEEESQNEDAVYHSHACDVFDDVRTNTYDGAVHLEYLKPRVSFPDDRAYRRSSQVAREYKKLSNDLKSIQGETTGARTALPKKITTAKYPTGKKFSFAIRTPEKSVSGDSLGLRYDVAEFTCECEEPFNHPSAAFPTGSCTCIGNDENAETNDSDSPRSISDTARCCWSCLSVTSRNEKDPVKKLESFCDRVKAINQDKPSKYICRNATNTKLQEYAHDKSDEQNQSRSSTQRAIRRVRLSERERLEDPARLRLEKPKHSHDRANLEKILIYPPRGEGGPPLTLYKRASNISCRVKGDVDTGFRYNVTYVQKFVSPAWMPSLTLEIPPRDTNERCGCSVDYG